MADWPRNKQEKHTLSKNLVKPTTFFNPENDPDPNRKQTFKKNTDPDPDRLPKVNSAGHKKSSFE
jgi:hypothetical protein